jgi:FkbM family methyltransferase
VSGALKIRRRLVSVHSVCNFLVNKARFFGKYGGLYTRKKVAERISNALLPQLEGPIMCPTIYGFDICLDKTNGDAVYHLGFYEAGTIDVIQRSLREGDIFVDVGSSIGIMSLSASKVVGTSGRVFAFEPDPQRFLNLLTSIEFNGISNVSANNHGLGSCTKKERLYTDRGSPSMVMDHDTDNYVETQVHSLDSFLEEHGIGSVNFIKIDVEGFEFEVLSGAGDLLSRQDSPIICIECNHDFHGSSSSSKNILTVIGEMNDYKFYLLSGTKAMVSKLRKINVNDEVIHGDNVFCIREHHRAYLPWDLFQE